ncbi:MAG: DUF58 domain-containing protein, partial [Actinomycetota bacterium]|nr:DUF58 domain-containing protein [Actinomycetota bacterium]
MVNRQGWVVVVASFGLLVAGRLLGVPEMFLLGTAGLVLVAVCLLIVARTHPNLSVQRVLHPPRVHVGMPSRVELSVRNDTTRRTAVVRLHDPVSDTAGAELLLGPLDPGRQLAAAYQLPTDRRGIIQAGPLRAVVSDPFGLAERSFPVAGVAELTVLPRVDQLNPLPHSVGRDDPHAGADHPNVLGQAGEDFYSLREYVVGDDLRRVHWASTARRGELMVRQDEVPWQGRATVLLDARRDTTSPESFELAVSAAASIIMASSRQRDLARLVITDGTDSGYVEGHSQVDQIMEQLAVVRRSRTVDLRPMLNLLKRAPGGGLVAILASPTGDDIDALVKLRGRFGVVTIVVFERSSWTSSSGAPDSRTRLATPSARNVRVLRITAEHPFASVWNEAILRPATSRAQRGGPST